MILLADSGSTKTNWILLNGKKIIAKINSLGINVYYQKIHEIEEELFKLKEQLPNDNIEKILFFGTGVNSEEAKLQLIICFKKIFGENVDCQLYSDIVAAGIALFPNENGIACILGTGSNSASFENEILVEQVPPLGFWLGDEGSGGHLGKLLILAYLHKQLPADLREKFDEQYGRKDRIEILNIAYKSEFPNRVFASYAKFIKSNEKHPFMDLLIKKSFQSFFDLYLLKYSNIGDKKIGFCGSIAFNFKEQLLEVCTLNKLNLPKIIQSPIDEITNNFLK